MIKPKAFIFSAFTLLLLFFAAAQVHAQGTSNKGTEFWTLYMDHIRSPTAAQGASQMILYITSDRSTTGNVSVADGSFTQNFTVTANTVTVVNIPANAFVGSQGKSLKGIHITSAKPIAVYAHIYASSVSGATLLLPVNTLGKEYYSINYKQVANDGPSYSTFAVIATEDNTTVEITPAEQLLNGEAKGVKFQVSLQKGEVYQGLSGTDLTGTLIRSVSTVAGTCKKIAVFSGSSKIGIGCSAPSQLSSDNLFQQAYPTANWGKNYITAPLKSRGYDIYRIVLSDPATQIKLNGIALAANQFVNSLYYEFTSTGPNAIAADKPIQVVQYTPTQSEGLNCSKIGGDVGDPEMIYLSPIEQGLDNVTLYSTGYYKILASYINVVIPTAAVPSFKLDGVAYTAFTPVTAKPGYSYAQISVSSGPSFQGGGSITSGTHTIKADQPFNAIAYGFGGTESYGYAAGTNQQDLNTHLVFEDPADNTKSLTGACGGQSYRLKLTIPYKTPHITWNLGNNTAPFDDNNPVEKSTTVVGGQTLFNYEYKEPVNYPVGSFTATATVFNPVADECGSDEEVEFYFSVSGSPVAAILADENNCFGDSTVFNDASVLADGVAIKTWLWDFDDNTTSAKQHPSHLYTAPGSYNVRLTVTDNNGCTSVSQPVVIHVMAKPVAAFNMAALACIGNQVALTDNSAVANGSITKRIWDFGDGSPKDSTSAVPFTHVFTNTGTFNVKLTVTSDKGCSSITAEKLITIYPVPVVDFILPNACIDDVARFIDVSTIADGTEAEFKYSWNFGDANATAANNISSQKNPQHKYSAAGTYTVTLTVTSKYQCAVTSKQVFTVNGAVPRAHFTINDACSSSDIIFNDTSVPSFGNITKVIWYFDYDNDPNASETYTLATMHTDKKYSHNYGLFNTPATRSYHVRMLAFSGESLTCINTLDSIIVINANPLINLSYNNTPIASPIVLCQDVGTIAIAQNKGIYAGTGMFSGTGISAAGVFDPAVSGPGIFTINYVFTADGTGCNYATSFQIVVNPTPVITATDEYVLLEGGQVLLRPVVNISSGTLSYSWSNAATLDHADVARPYAMPVESTTYTLTATSDKGCTVQANIFVKVLKKPLIPTAFTPNADGINDTWQIKYLDSYPDVTVDIYNRYGERVYFSKGYASPWDGSGKGNTLPAGTYYYIINPGSGRKTTTGYVSIIR